MLDDVRTYARRHPGTFLAGAAVAGLLVGRLTRGLTASGSDGSAGGGSAGGSAGGGSAGGSAGAAAEQPYTGTARAQNVSPAGRTEPDVPGRVGP
ncbi:hypothetical protein GCM10027614_54210 [Micromonospora vulcania]